jgi:hypothetical protein
MERGCAERIYVIIKYHIPSSHYYSEEIYYVMYYILSSGGFTKACVRPSRNVPSITVQFSTTRRPLVSYSHVVYVTCYFCYMFRFSVARVARFRV